MERGLIGSNPAAGVKREAVKPYGRATWLDVGKDHDKDFLRLPDLSTTQGLRDRAIMALLLGRGLRVAEAARLTVGDLAEDGPGALLASIRRKGGDDERVALGRAASEAIAAYLATRSPLSDDSPLFVATAQGRKAAAALGRYGDDDKPLTTRAIRYLVKTYSKRIGYDDIRPHSLRHTAAHRLDFEGATFRGISAFLGHANGRVTDQYLQTINKRKTADQAVDTLDLVYGGQDE